jgi:hypothetical protein
MKAKAEVRMKFELKSLSPEAVPRALEKAERYRFLNEPGEAESICLDILEVDPANRDALVTLVLALTDQFDAGVPGIVGEARQAIERLEDQYSRAYYTAIVFERRAKAELRHPSPGRGPLAYGWLREAMVWYEKAEGIRPHGNDDALLRWNACARLLNRDQQLVPPSEERGEPLLLE